jgi:hypothetical protein
VCGVGAKEIQKAKPMTRGSGSPIAEGLRGEILRFAQDDGIICVCSTARSFVHSTLQFPLCSILRLVSALRIQHQPYKALEKRRLRGVVRENAFFGQTTIKMSVLAGVGGSSFHR